MSIIKKIATAGAVAIMGLGVSAASASAYSIDGISGNPYHYTGIATSSHSFTVGGAYTISCPANNTTFTGVADGSDTTAFTPYFGADENSPNGTGYVCEFFGLPARVEQDGPWSITVDNGPDIDGWYTGEVEIPAGTSTTISVTLAGCSVRVDGQQTFAHGVNGNVARAKNVSGGVELEAEVNGIAYTQTGCPFPDGNDGQYRTNGVVDIPGIEINP
ncbi:MAG: hypothetical protein ITG02_09565 [Patulibacter sp.]|nr:hypothetical protein [Patulibacter sp.]